MKEVTKPIVGFVIFSGLFLFVDHLEREIDKGSSPVLVTDSNIADSVAGVQTEKSVKNTQPANTFKEQQTSAAAAIESGNPAHNNKLARHKVQHEPKQSVQTDISRKSDHNSSAQRQQVGGSRYPLVRLRSGFPYLKAENIKVKTHSQVVQVSFTLLNHGAGKAAGRVWARMGYFYKDRHGVLKKSQALTSEALNVAFQKRGRSFAIRKMNRYSLTFPKENFKSRALNQVRYVEIIAMKETSSIEDLKHLSSLLPRQVIQF